MPTRCDETRSPATLDTLNVSSGIARAIASKDTRLAYIRNLRIFVR
jgi:hypothetical protein